MNWSTIEREAYAVLSALKKFDCWIFGSQIQVVSDHNPLTFLTKGLPHGTKFAHWTPALQRFDLWITNRKGKNHGNAVTPSLAYLSKINLCPLQYIFFLQY
ncbi:hypothetical protein TNCV_3222301 [Trichonephila clavipes]|nr:hypothetical protein TNCV_3222301 [Trichonephila clavipes]